MTTTTRNEAAERLRQWAGFRKDISLVRETIDEALATERKATVERIQRVVDVEEARQAGPSASYILGKDVMGTVVSLALDAILDEEAAQ